MSEMGAVRSEQNSLGLVGVPSNKLGGTQTVGKRPPSPRTFTRCVPARRPGTKTSAAAGRARWEEWQTVLRRLIVVINGSLNALVELEVRWVA
jgi:hypothetical protein